ILMERCGYAAFRSGMQASTSMEFRDNLLKAVSFYRKANRTLPIRTEPANVARIHRCEAFVWYLRYWLTSRPSEKVGMLEKASLQISNRATPEVRCMCSDSTGKKQRNYRKKQLSSSPRGLGADSTMKTRWREGSSHAKEPFRTS